jgi:hypothetical protein
LEEVEIRVSEIKKAMYEFKRDIVQQAVNPRTGKVIAERVLRYFEDKIRSKVGICVGDFRDNRSDNLSAPPDYRML